MNKVSAITGACRLLQSMEKKHTLYYADLALDIARTHLAFELSGIKRVIKSHSIGRNSPGWIVVFIATITYGATIVPILQDFNPTDATHILNHSESVLLFVDDHIWENLEFEQMPNVRGRNIPLQTGNFSPSIRLMKGK